VDACTGDLYFGSYDGSAYCATFDGALKWHREMPGSITIPPVVGQNGKVYFYSNSYEHEVDDITYIFPSTLRALNPGGGGDYWTHYVYYSDTLYGLEASTPMVMDSDDNLYLTDSSGYLFSVEPGYDSYRWNTTLGSSAPIIAGGTVLVPELGTLRALGTSGTGLWSFGYGIGDTPAISADGKIYIWGGEGIGLYVLDLITGEQLHSLETHGNGRDMVLYSHHLKGRLLFIDGADTLSCYEVSSGPASGSWAQYGGTYKHLNRREDAPWVSIDSPDEGAVLSGEESVLINGSDDMTCIPMKAHVYVDDALVDTTNSLPYAYQWHTGASQDGNYTLTVLGVDKAGNESRTHVNVTVDNPAAPTYGPADPIPTFSWNAPDGEKKYRIYFATDSDFNNIITRKKRWTKKTSWTPSKKKWKKVLAVAAGSTPRIVYWKVIGKKTGLVHMGMFYVTN